MPVYDYQCTACGREQEVRQQMSAMPPECPACHQAMHIRILSAPAVHGHMARGREAAVRSLPETGHGKGCPCCS